MRIFCLPRAAVVGASLLLAVLASGCGINPAPASTPAPETVVSAPSPTNTPPAFPPAPTASVTAPPRSPGASPTGSPLASVTVTATASVPTTPTATYTPAPSQALQPAAQALLQQLDAFEVAFRSGDTQAILARQRDLLSQASQAEQDLSADQSDSANQVRSALDFVRAGARGDLGKIGEARKILRPLAGLPEQSSDTVQGIGTPSPATVAEAASALRQSLNSFRAALREGRSDQLLAAQEKLLADLKSAEKAVHAESSGSADELRSAIADIKNGLGGDQRLLDLASQKLGGNGGALGTPTAAADSTQVQPLARSLAEKVDAFAQSLQSGDQQSALSRQREALVALAALQQAVQNSETKQSRDLKAAAQTLQQGLNGDQGKIAEGRRQLAQAMGTSAPEADVPQSAGSAAQAEISRRLVERLNAFSEALASGDTDRLLREQNALIDEATRAEASLQGDNSPASLQLRSALEDLRAGLNGDRAKLESAKTKLSGVSGQ